MRKHLLGLLLALFIIIGFNLPAHATASLTNNITPVHYGNSDYYSPMITAAGNYTTSPAYGPVIDNRDGSVSSIDFIANVTNDTGTSPTLQLVLQGSVDGTNFVTVQSNQASTAGTTSAIQTSATDISSGAATFGLGTAQFNRIGGFYPFLRIEMVIGGSATPGWTGTIAATVHRSSHQSAFFN